MRSSLIQLTPYLNKVHILCIRMYPLVIGSLHLLSEHLKYLNTITGCSFFACVCICSVVCSIRVYKQHSFFVYQWASFMGTILS